MARVACFLYGSIMYPNFLSWSIVCLTNGPQFSPMKPMLAFVQVFALEVWSLDIGANLVILWCRLMSVV